MARGEVHAQLIVDYADDPKLSEVSRSARLLWVDALLLSKRLLSDGIVTFQQATRIAYPETPAKARALVAELVNSGAFEERDGRCYYVSGFLKRNKSKAQIVAEREAAQEAADRGNHNRWHVAKGEQSPTCRFCVGETIAPPIAPPIGSASGSTSRVVSPETETETETEITTSSAEPPREDVEAICQHLADRINEHVSKPVRVIDSWRKDARKLLDLDKRPIEEAFQLIDWCQADSFWQPNILSMAKFRQKYEQLRLKSRSQGQKAAGQRLGPGGFIRAADPDDDAWAM